MRININLADELVKETDERAKGMYLSRSAYITLALRQKLDSDKLLEHLPEFANSMNKLSQDIQKLKVK